MANDESPTLDQAPRNDAGQTGPESGHHRRRKRKVKRSSRIARKAGYIIALGIAWLVLLAIWYYLVNRPTTPPPS